MSINFLGKDSINSNNDLSSSSSSLK